MAPQIIEGPVALGITDTLATIFWVTDEESIDSVRYRPKRDGEWLTVTGSEYIRIHNVTLTGLERNTRYQYEVTSTDPSGNTSEPVADEFKTDSQPDLTAPRIIQGPAASGITDNQATIEWKTEEISDSKVSYGPDHRDESDWDEVKSSCPNT